MAIFRKTRATRPLMHKTDNKLPALSLRIDLDEDERIGPAKIQLLEQCRQPAVDRQTGGKNGGGAALTPFGESLVARYRKIERDAAAAVRKELAALRSEIGKPKKVAGR